MISLLCSALSLPKTAVSHGSWVSGLSWMVHARSALGILSRNHIALDLVVDFEPVAPVLVSGSDHFVLQAVSLYLFGNDTHVVSQCNVGLHYSAVNSQIKSKIRLRSENDILLLVNPLEEVLHHLVIMMIKVA